MGIIGVRFASDRLDFRVGAVNIYKYMCMCERSNESRFHYFREMFNRGVNICMCGKLISYVLVEDCLICECPQGLLLISL